MQELKPNEQRAKYAIMLIWIILCLEAILLILYILNYSILRSGIVHLDIYGKLFDLFSFNIGITYILYVVAFLFSAITFLNWFRRAYSNLSKLSYSLSYEEYWSVRAWFIPILNLVRPYKIMYDMFKETNEIMISNNLTKQPALNTKIVGWWWGLWIVNSIVANIDLKYYFKAETIFEITRSIEISIFSTLLGIGLAIVTIKMLKSYSIYEASLNEIPIAEDIINFKSRLE